MKKISIAQFFAGLAMLIIGFLVNMVMNAVWPISVAEYANTTIFRSWTDQIMLFYYVYPFIVAIMLARIWQWLTPLNPNWLKFGWYGFLTMTVPGMLVTFASFQVSLGMTIGWTITGFLQLFAASYIFSKIITK
ncbi:MAG: hypothetical protein Q8L36_00205 [bacterium]|nr:hypothetical protein [bacterium]